MRDVYICTIVKDEGRYLAEWIEFHLLMGVKMFYIYDNDSTDDTGKVLDYYKKLGVVYVIPFPGACRQPDMCREFIHRFKKSNVWVAFIDIDEFLYLPADKRPINQYMDRFSAYGGVCVNWLLMGSSGHSERPSGLVCTNYLFGSSKPDKHVKTILNMTYAVSRGKDVHSFRSSRPIINQLFMVQPIDYALSDYPLLSGSGLILFHYHTKSFEDYKIKCSRNRADIPQKRDIAKDFPAHDVNEVRYDQMSDMGDAIESMLKNRRNELGE